MNYWSMWLDALALWHRLVDPTEQIHGHLTYNEEVVRQVSE